MIEKDETEAFNMFCDKCSNYESFEVNGDFKETISQAKKLGWTFREDEYGRWEHYCPCCQKEE